MYDVDYSKYIVQVYRIILTLEFVLFNMAYIHKVVLSQENDDQ
jgi:hypothetical protein